MDGCSARGVSSKVTGRFRSSRGSSCAKARSHCSSTAIPTGRFVMPPPASRWRRRIGSIDLEMLGRSVQGLALVTSGAVAEGMRTLDEVNAAVVAGELHDLIAIGLACCYLIAACDRVRDYDRAMQWCTRLKAFCARWGLRPLFAVCRTQYASICMWRGTWLEAEQELTAATDELAASRPGDDRRRARSTRRAAPSPGPPGRSGRDVRAVGAAQPGVDRPRGDCARSRRSAGGRRARRALHASRDAAQPHGARRRARAARACARAHGRHGRRQNRAHRAHQHRHARRDAAAQGVGELRGRIRRRRRRRSERRAAPLRGRRRSLPAERRAVRGVSRAHRAGARRWPPGDASTSLARRRSARWICSAS